jgi:hypothetical protein
MKKAGHIFCILLAGGAIIAAIKTSVALAGLWHDSALGWTKVPCVIREFEVETDYSRRDPYRIKVGFDYQAGGAPRSGNRLWPWGQVTRDYEDISRSVAALTAKSPHPPADLRNFETECLVDPDDPTRAVLAPGREQVAWAFGMTAAVLFSAGAFVFFYRRQRVTGKTRIKRDPILLALFLTFAMSGVFTAGFSTWGLAERWQMRRWIEVPATVVYNDLEFDSGGGRRSGSARARILYRYEIDGREYLSNRTTVLEAYSGRRSTGPRAVVRSHPPGTPIHVFVSPDQPWRAVMDRNLGASGLILLIPLPFLALGFLGVARLSWPKPRRSHR